MSCPCPALLFMPSSKDIETINKIINKYKITGIRTLWRQAGGSTLVFPTSPPAQWAHVNAGLWQVTDMPKRVTVPFWWCSFWPWLALGSRRSSGLHWWEQGWRLNSHTLLQAPGWFTDLWLHLTHLLLQPQQLLPVTFTCRYELQSKTHLPTAPAARRETPPTPS